MVSRLFASNNAFSTLAAGIGSGDTSLTVATGEGSRFPSQGAFNVTIDSEIIGVLSRSGDTFNSLLRGREGTTPASHSSGADVENRITARYFDVIYDVMDANIESAVAAAITEQIPVVIDDTIEAHHHVPRIGQNGPWWGIPGWYIGNVSTSTPPPGSRIYIPFYVSHFTTYDRVGINVVTAAGAGNDARLALYASDFGFSRIFPTDLIQDFGTVDIDSTGNKVVVIDIDLEPGWYFLMVLVEDTGAQGVFTCPSADEVVPPISGVGLTLGAALTGILMIEGTGIAASTAAPNPAVLSDSTSTRSRAIAFLRSI